MKLLLYMYCMYICWNKSFTIRVYKVTVRTKLILVVRW